MVLLFKKTKKQNGVIGISIDSFCYLTNEAWLFCTYSFFFCDIFSSFGLALSIPGPNAANCRMANEIVLIIIIIIILILILTLILRPPTST